MKILEENGFSALVTNGYNVFHVNKPVELYTDGAPMGARFECTLDHFNHFRGVYADQYAKERER